MQISVSKLFIKEIVKNKYENYFDVAYSILTKELINNPLSFLEMQTWSEIINNPPIYKYSESLEKNVEFVTDVMRLLSKIHNKNNNKVSSGIINAFLNGAHFRITAHSDVNLKKLMKERSNLINNSSYISKEQDYFFKTPVANISKPRIGIIFRHIQQDPETSSLFPFISQAKESGIEVYLLSYDNKIYDQFGRNLCNFIDHSILLSKNLMESINQIRALNLDILIYGNDITAKLSNAACISFHKVARKSIIAVSTLTTTCSKYVDYYMGSTYHYNRGCSQEFTEKYIKLPDPGFSFYFNNNEVNSEEENIREKYSIDSDHILFVSGANKTKLHEPVLLAWAKILKLVPNSNLILYPFPPHFGKTNDSLILNLKNYFHRKGLESNRIIILNQLSNRNEVKKILKQTDIGLDSFPYPGVTTIVDAIESGIPTVVIAGNTLRSSQSAAINSSMGLNELISENIENYIELAVKLAKNHDFRNEIKFRINEINLRSQNYSDTKNFGDAIVKEYYNIHSELQKI